MIVVRNISNGKSVFLNLEGENSSVSCFCMSRDGKLLASGHSTAESTKVPVFLWDLTKAKSLCEEGTTLGESSLIRRLDQHFGCVRALEFSCDNGFLITLGGRDDNNLVVWNVESGDAICGCPAGNEIALCVRWLNRRNDRFVTCGDFSFRVWQVCYITPKMHPIDAKMAGMRRVMQCLSISFDDKFAFVGSQSGEVLKFGIDRVGITSCTEANALTPCLLNYTRERYSMGVKSVAVIINPTTGNTNVFAGAGDGTILLLNPKLLPIKSHRTSLVGGVTSICVAPDAKKLCAGTDMSQRYTLDIPTFTPKLSMSCHFHPIFDIKFPKGCSDLFVTASFNDLRVWETKQIREIIRIQVPNLQCRALELLPDGTCILSAWSDGKIRAFLPQSGKVKFMIPEAHPDGATCLSFCNYVNKSKYRLVSGGKDFRVRVWEISDSQQVMVHSMKEHRGEIRSIVCNSNGTRAISSSTDGSCIVWDVQRGIRIHALFEQALFNKAMFHPDESQYLTCGSHKKITYWDAYEGSAIREIDSGGDELICLDIEKNGKFFVSGGADGLLKLWHYDDGETLAVARGHGGRINNISLDPDQRRVVTVGSEGGIFIWNVSDKIIKKEAEN